MMPAHDVAKYFVSLVDEEAGDSITNLKLQKLLYYAQGAHLALYNLNPAHSAGGTLIAVLD